MKVLGVLTTAIVFLVLASRMPAYSQERDDAKQDQTQEQKDKAKNNDKDKARQGDNARRPDERSQPEANRPQEQRQDQRTDQRQDQRQDQRPEQGQAQRADQDRGGQRAEGQRGRHIDDDKFRSSFGRQHVFHVDRTRIVNSPQPVVVYGGYQFQLVDAWPADWGYDDDVYVDYIDGEYFLFDARHPGIRIAVFVLD
jgi:hypothetical protein